jgi:hypothetical protein
MAGEPSDRRSRPLVAEPRERGTTDLLEPGTPLPDLSRGDRHGVPDPARLAFSRPPVASKATKREQLAERGRRFGDQARDLPTRQIGTALVVIVVGAGLLLGWAVHVSWTPLADAALVAVGAILVVQSRRNAVSRPLIALGVMLAVIAAGTWRAGVTLDGGFGKRTVVPTRAGTIERKLGTGQMTIDLRKIPRTSGTVDLKAEVGIGRLVIVVPHGSPVVTHTTAGGGMSIVFSKGDLGGGVEHRRLATADGSRLIRIDASVGIGSVEVRRG